MKSQLIYDLLEKHPYFEELSNADKISVMNIALTNLYFQLEDQISWGKFTNGQVGWDGNVLDVDDVYVLPQSEIAQLNLSTYKSVDINLSNNEFLKNYTQEERQVIYNIALAKIAEKIPNRYTIQNTTSDLEYFDQNTIDFPYTSYEMFTPVISDLLHRFAFPTITISEVASSTISTYFNFPTVSYEVKLLDDYIEYLYLPKVVVEYEIENIPGDRGKVIPDLPYSTLDYPSVNVEFITITGDSETVISDLTTQGIKVAIEYEQFETATDPDLTDEKFTYLSKPRVIYTKY